MSSLIETVARAAYERHRQRAAAIIGREVSRPWEALGHRAVQHYLNDARDNIAAMREPTNEMLIAGYRRIDDSEQPSAGDIWQAMIDEALRS